MSAGEQDRECKRVYKPPGTGGREELVAAVRIGIPGQICDAMVAAVFNVDDWRWLQNQYVALTGHEDDGVRGLAATCLGHIATFHKTLDVEVVLPLLEGLLDHELTRGQAMNAIEDIEMGLYRFDSGTGGAMVVLDGNQIRTEDDLHEALAGRLGFGGSYGRNIAALRDRLSTDVERPVLVVWRNPAASMAHLGEEAFDRIVSVFDDVAQQDKAFGPRDRFTYCLDPEPENLLRKPSDPGLSVPGNRGILGPGTH